MRRSVFLSILTSITITAGCQSVGGTAMADAPVKVSGSLGSTGDVAFAPSWISVATTDWVIAPIAISDSSVTAYSLTKLGGSYRPQLPQAEGFGEIGNGPWINFAVFNRSSGKSTLALDRRAIVWHVARSEIESDSLLLVMTDTDTNRDGKLNDLDATAVYHLKLTDSKLTRLTPDRTTVVSTSPDPVIGGKPRRSFGGIGHAVEEDPKRINGLLVTVRTDINNDGKFEKDEPTQVVRIDPSLKNPPQSVMDASQWQKAIDVWKNG